MQINGIEFDSMILGAGRLGDPLYKEECFRILDRYAELGGKTLDVARSYQDGRCEEFLGEYFRKRKNRDKFILISKGGFPLSRSAMYLTRTDRKNMTEDLEGSLRALGTDHIDLYFLHRDNIDAQPQEQLETMNIFFRQGKVRLLGASNWSAGRIGLANTFAAENGMEPFRCSQINWSLAKTTPPLTGDLTHMIMNDTEFAWYRENQFPVIAYSVQAKGFFSKQISGRELKDSGKRSYLPLKENFRRADRLRKLAEETGHTMPQLLIAYILSKGLPAMAIGGFSTVEQLNDTWPGAFLRLTEKQIHFLEG